MKKLNLPVLLLSIIALAACQKNNENVITHSAMNAGNNLDGGTVSRNADVYVVGFDQNNAVYWLNGSETTLSKTVAGTTFTSAVARAVVVFNNDVYIAGYGTDSKGGNTAILWKNGVPDTLSHPVPYTGYPAIVNSRALAITIDHNNVYINGDNYGDRFRNYFVWKNNKTLDFYGGYNSPALFVSKGDIYATGAGGGSEYPSYNKNGSEYTMNCRNTFHAFVKDVCVADTGNDVYAVGIDETPAYWVNGVEYFVQNLYYGSITGVTMLDKKLYFIGQGAPVPPYNWTSGFICKDGLPIVSQRQSNFLKIFANSSGVYIAGSRDTIINGANTTAAYVWKNTIRTQLSTHNSAAYGVYANLKM